MYIYIVQVQRKQLHKTVQGTESKSTKPSASPSPPKETTKQQNKNKEEEQAVKEKLQKLSLDDTQETLLTAQSPESSSKSTTVNKKPTVTRDQERIQSDSSSHTIRSDGDQDTSNSQDVEQQIITTGEQEEQETVEDGDEKQEEEREEAEEEGESGDQEELKAKVEEAEEQLLKRLERMQVESQETQETIKKMTGYLKALDVAPDVISTTDEGASPQPESQGSGDGDGGVATGGSASVMVGDIDPIAQAALLASIKERTTTSARSSQEDEAGEVMEPVQVTETDPSNVVVGEIVGGAQVVPTKSTVEEDTAGGEAMAIDPNLEYEKSGDLIGQTVQESGDQNVDDTPGAPKTEPSPQQDSTVVDQGSNEEGAGESSEGSKGAKETAEAPLPSFHSPSKKPKRQLAASFMNVNKE